MKINEEDRVIWRPELTKLMGVTSNTVRRWMKTERLPKPDVDMSRKTQGWRISTLRSAGINIAPMN